MTKYVLEIYKPDSAYEPLVTLKSETPFQSIHVGDFIEPRHYNLSGDNKRLTGKLLRVISIRHHVTHDMDMNAVRHQLNVFTEAAPGAPETMLQADAEDTSL